MVIVVLAVHLSVWNISISDWLKLINEPRLIYVGSELFSFSFILN